jgi:cytochrome P450
MTDQSDIVHADATEVAEFPPPRDRRCPLDPPAELVARIHEPVAKVRQWDGLEPWLITKYDEVRAVLTDRRFSADPRKEGYPEKTEAYGASVGQDRNLRTMDAPEHGIQKRMLIRDFTIKRVEELRPAIQARVDSLIDDMLAKGPPADIVTDYAMPIPTMVICELLGVPYKDRDFFKHHTEICMSSDHPIDVATASSDELYNYIDALLDVKAKDPRNDLLSRLVTEQLLTGVQTRREVVEMARLILIAGHDTTANMIAVGTVALLANPDQAALMRQPMTPAELSNAVDEMFRYVNVTHTGRRRVATEDVQVGDRLIKKGEGVIVMTNLADRDETVFPNAAKLDLKRPNARTLMAFGAGDHRCMGAYLSKAEMEIAFGTLWRRIPSLKLAVPFEELRFREEGVVYGMREVPVTWDA